ncbi:MAG: hypothetical protein HQ502_19320 [Alphaproteobacteria bacterium]|nr:hypothetical protein [Alphaproteobacteria bacterium]
MAMYSRFMRVCLNFMLAATCLSIFTPGLMAAPIHDFNKALGDTMRHYRWAGYYLHTGNIALAQLELDGFVLKAGELSERYALSPPGIFADDPDWTSDIKYLPITAMAALAASDTGDVKKAESLLAPVRARMGSMRRRNGLFLFGDCIDAANGAFDRLWRVRHQPPDFTKPAPVDEMRQDLAVTLYWYRRCQEEAPAAVRGNQQFQRLMEDSVRSLSLIWEAARNKNSRRIINILREVRSADRLLYLNFY